MANPPQDKSQRRGAARFLAASFIVHAVVFVVLLATGALTVDMFFDRAEAADKAASAEQRREELEKRQRERLRKQVLPEEHARVLRESVERARRDEVVKRIKRIQGRLDEVKQIKRRKLEEVHDRTYDAVRERQIDRVVMAAENLKTAAQRYRTTREERKEIFRQSSEILGMAQQLAAAEGPNDAPEPAPASVPLLWDRTLEVVETTRAAADAPRQPTGSQSLGLPEDKQKHVAAVRLREEVAKLVPEERFDPERFNDTTSARALDTPPALSPDALDRKTLSELYAEATRIEKEIADHLGDTAAADRAIQDNSSYADAKQQTPGPQTPARPDLAGELNPPDLNSIDKVNAFRDAAGTARDQIRAIDLRTASLLTSANRLGARDLADSRLATKLRDALARSAQQRGRMDVSRAMRMAMAGGEGPGVGSDKEFYTEEEGGRFMAHIDKLPGIRLPNGQILAQAMPGRRFAKNASRHGWLYLDTWYMVGPWENGGSIDYARVHPPEDQIDFDAVYADGKGGQELRWEFIQTNNIRFSPSRPGGTADSTFYLYTEVEFDEATDMLVAIASDDASKVWINGHVIWQENGLSQWNLGEGMRKVYFKRGTNTILARVENGPNQMEFSFLVCPPDAIKK